jgi:hypothetical protein
MTGQALTRLDRATASPLPSQDLGSGNLDPVGYKDEVENFESASVVPFRHCVCSFASQLAQTRNLKLGNGCVSTIVALRIILIANAVGKAT